jgi:preprotein translocase subunit SecF
MLHDLLVVLGVEAALGYLLGWEADALFLTAVLTVIGFTVHDSIVVFDRIRENSGIYRRVDYEKIVNHSIVQTLDRSINTQLTVMFTLLSLALFWGDSTRHFVIILLVGIFSGTYSSIFNAAPITRRLGKPRVGKLVQTTAEAGCTQHACRSHSRWLILMLA